MNHSSDNQPLGLNKQPPLALCGHATPPQSTYKLGDHPNMATCKLGDEKRPKYGIHPNMATCKLGDEKGARTCSGHKPE